MTLKKVYEHLENDDHTLNSDWSKVPVTRHVSEKIELCLFDILMLSQFVCFFFKLVQICIDKRFELKLDFFQGLTAYLIHILVIYAEIDVEIRAKIFFEIDLCTIFRESFL